MPNRQPRVLAVVYKVMLDRDHKRVPFARFGVAVDASHVYWAAAASAVASY